MRDGPLRSTALRLSLTYAVLYAALTACVLLAAFLFASSELREWVEQDVRAELLELRAIYEGDGLTSVQTEIDREIAVANDSSLLYQLTDPSGALLAGNARGIPTFEKRLLVRREAITVLGALDDEAVEFLARHTMLGENRLVAAKSTHVYEETSEALIEVMAAGFALLLLLGVGLGFILSRRTERRIVGIREALAAVSEGALSRRAPEDRTEDDLARVSSAINGALDRLQALIESQQQISSDIAHDLQTPIQRLRQRLEQARPSDAATSDVIEAGIADIDAITATFQALLRIAQIEGGARRERFRTVDLRDLCTTVSEAFGAVAEDEGHVFTCALPERPARVHGDAELLTQLVANVVENAIRHCPPGAKITLALDTAGPTPRLRVSDTGPGIPADERERVLRRLYRVEKSRTTAGNGLGLSLVKAIADLHGARLDLSDNGPGLAVGVTFPAP